MTTGTKIALSAKELELVNNTDWILTKHLVIQKVYELLGHVSVEMKNILAANRQHIPGAAFNTHPKISKGENYRLLPYIMLDYPRYFTKSDVLAIRTFFWWGNFFSVNLHVAGMYKDAVIAAAAHCFTALQQKGYAACIGTDPWEHHFEKDNFLPLEQLSVREFRELTGNSNFIKLSKKISLYNWEEVPGFITETFSELAALLDIDQAPSR